MISSNVFIHTASFGTFTASFYLILFLAEIKMKKIAVGNCCLHSLLSIKGNQYIQEGNEYDISKVAIILLNPGLPPKVTDFIAGEGGSAFTLT